MHSLKTSLITLSIPVLALASSLALGGDDDARLELLGLTPASGLAEEAPATQAAENRTTGAQETTSAGHPGESAAPPPPTTMSAEAVTAPETPLESGTPPEAPQAMEHPANLPTAPGTPSPPEAATPKANSPETAVDEAVAAGDEAPHRDKTVHEAMTATHKPATAHHGGVHWGYEGAGAPQYWGELKAEYATCGTGHNQSPIDISAVVVTHLPDIRIDYQPTPLAVVNNGHAIQVNYQAGSSISVGGKRFNLLQFHLHSPSEHTIGGKTYAMVAHLVHKADDGQLGVIAIFIREGRANPFLDQVLENMPEEAGTTQAVPGVEVNVADLLPRDLTYFNYTGSLTTPPCTEGVNWMVLATPVEASQAQIARFRRLYDHDARPVQPVNGRTIRLGN